MKNSRKYRICIAIKLVALAASLVSQNLLGQESASLNRLAGEMSGLVDESLSTYNAAIESIANEKTPLVRKIGELENGNIELRRELNRNQRIIEEGKSILARLNTEFAELESQTEYIERMLDEYLTKFESRIHMAEDQRFKPSLTEIRGTLSGQSADLAERFKLHAKALTLGLGRQEESFGGYKFSGKAIDSKGDVRTGDVAVLGPAAYFVSEDRSTGGMLRFHSGTVEPEIAELEPDYVAGLAALVSEGSGDVPFDASLGDAFSLDDANLTPLEHVNQGGIVGYFILALGAAALLLSIVKLTDLSRFSSNAPSNINEIASRAREKGVDEAMAAAPDAKGVVREMLEMGTRNVNANTVLLEEMMLSVVLKRRPEMERFLPFLAITAAASPLLGLLGTVVGMIKTFALITVFGTGDPQALSSGISEALVTTELGLIVAIPTLVLHGLFTRIVRSRVSVMEQIAFEFAKLASAGDDRGAA